MQLLSTFFNLLPVTLAQSLIYAFVSLGIVTTFRIINFPDVTSEGAFPLGGCVCGKCLAVGLSPLVAVAAGCACGFAAGCATAFINIKFRINSLLAGIVVVTMLYSIDLRVLGRSNVPLFYVDTVFSAIGAPYGSDICGKLLLLVATVVFVAIGMYLALRSEHGILFRATGANPVMAEAQGVNVNMNVVIGVGLAGLFAAAGGALLVQSQAFADVNVGVGVLVGGLAAVIIGEAVVAPTSLVRIVVSPIVGSVVYFQLVSLCLALSVPPADLKLATGAFVLVMLALPSMRSMRKPKRARRLKPSPQGLGA